MLQGSRSDLQIRYEVYRTCIQYGQSKPRRVNSTRPAIPTKILEPEDWLLVARNNLQMSWMLTNGGCETRRGEIGEGENYATWAGTATSKGKGWKTETAKCRSVVYSLLSSPAISLGRRFALVPAVSAFAQLTSGHRPDSLPRCFRSWRWSITQRELVLKIRRRFVWRSKEEFWWDLLMNVAQSIHKKVVSRSVGQGCVVFSLGPPKLEYPPGLCTEITPVATNQNASKNQ